MGKLKNFLSTNAMLVVLLLTMLLFEVMIQNQNRGSMFSPENLTNLIGQNGYVVILATGMLLCILTGGNIDLSVGSIVILVGAVAGIFICNWGLDPYLSIFLCLIVGTLIGAWQAFWIAYIGIPPFITTLAGMLTFRGLALFIMKSENIGPFPDKYKALFNDFIPGQGNEKTLTISLIIGVVICVVYVGTQLFFHMNKNRKGYEQEKFIWLITRLVAICGVIMFMALRLGQNKGIPVALILLGAIVIFYSYHTQNMVHGRYLYAMGGNQKAARLSGVNVKNMMFFAYTNMGFLSGIAALVCVARFNQAGTQAGTGFELDAIGACFIGGASAYGGIGKVGGAVIGAIFMGVLNMGMSILGMDMNLQRLIKGLVLLGAVIFDVLTKNRKQAA